MIFHAFGLASVFLHWIHPSGPWVEALACCVRAPELVAVSRIWVLLVGRCVLNCTGKQYAIIRFSLVKEENLFMMCRFSSGTTHKTMIQRLISGIFSIWSDLGKLSMRVIWFRRSRHTGWKESIPPKIALFILLEMRSIGFRAKRGAILYLLIAPEF